LKVFMPKVASRATTTPGPPNTLLKITEGKPNNTPEEAAGVRAFLTGRPGCATLKLCIRRFGGLSRQCNLHLVAGPDTDRDPLVRDSLPLLAGAAAGMAGIGAALVLADISSPLRAPFTLFFLLAAPGCALAAVLRGLDPLSRAVLATGGAVVIDVLVAQVMLALHLWSARGGVAVVAALSVLLFLLSLLRATD
jgi:hypothetical protein